MVQRQPAASVLSDDGKCRADDFFLNAKSLSDVLGQCCLACPEVTDEGNYVAGFCRLSESEAESARLSLTVYEKCSFFNMFLYLPILQRCVLLLQQRLPSILCAGIR